MSQHAAEADSEWPIALTLGHREQPLDDGWESTRTEPGRFGAPRDVMASAVTWQMLSSPTTQPTQATEGGFDACDTWYRLQLDRAPASPASRRLLRFGGLATLVDVWLNDERLLSSDNMFVAHAYDVTAMLARPGPHTLVICARALRPVLSQRRSRGRWPTRLISDKHLRFVRTSFLGYMPGWYPPIGAVGPWRGVHTIDAHDVLFERSTLRARVDGSNGVLRYEAVCRLLGAGLDSAVLRCGDREIAAEVSVEGEGHVRLRAELTLDQVALWWPHTHGEPVLHDASLRLLLDQRERHVPLGRVGFRGLALDRDTDGLGFGLRVNGRDVFCRGACWAPLDATALHTPVARLRAALERARDAGFNMVRVGGTMTYERDEFHALCDELGILVWQDFMFANVDYPVDDPGFVASCRREVQQWLARTGSRCSTVVLCGNSEVQQQAAMMGLPRGQWSNAWFDRELPGLIDDARLDAVYVPSTPSGGALPFHVDAGVGHYYGVGAYLRPVTDVRTAHVRFAAECLAFSNPPEPDGLRDWLGATSNIATDPRYRQSVPRDPGASWDFADVADHYVQHWFGVDAQQLRAREPERYLDLSRITIAATMAEVIGQLRQRTARARGALIWMLHDPQLGAGWGVIDGRGVPKAPYYALRRVCSPRALWWSDEGVNGLVLIADNEPQETWHGRVSISVFRDDGLRIAHVEHGLDVPGGGQRRWNAEQLIGHFIDASYAYRFGPPGHRFVVAQWCDPQGHTCTAVHELTPWRVPTSSDREAISVELDADGPGAATLLLQATRVVPWVAFDAPGWRAIDNYLPLVPGVVTRVALRGDASAPTPTAACVRVVGAPRG